MNEFDFINKYFKPLVSKEARNLNDDAAIFRPKIRNEIVISTDSLVEGIHFFGHENPSDIAKKSLRVNLSDIAAMGAKPIFYNLALNIPKHKVNKFIPKGKIILRKDLTFKRPGTGIDVNKIDLVLKRIAKKSLKIDTILKFNHLK